MCPFVTETAWRSCIVGAVLAFGIADLAAAAPLFESVVAPAQAPAASWASWLDQVAPEAVFVLDESGGFAEIDPWWVSLLGDSPMWTRWRLVGVDVSDLWEPGTTALRPAADLVSMPRLRDATLGGPSIDIGFAADTRLRAALAWQHGKAGDLWPPAHQIMAALSGAHPRDRELRPVSVRPRLLDPVRVIAVGRDHQGDGRVFSSLWVGKRRFPVFSPVTRDTVAEPLFAGIEDEAFAAIQAGWILAGGRRGLMLDVRVREREGMERWRTPEQSFRGRHVAAGGWSDIGGWSLGALLQVRGKRSPVTDYSVDLHDPDGQETEPWRTPAGTVAAGRLEAARQFDAVAVTAMLELAGYRPHTQRRVHPLLFEGRPYGRAEVVSSSRTLARPTVEVHWANAFSGMRVTGAVDAGGLAAAMLQSGGNPIGLADWQAGLSLYWAAQRRIAPFFRLRKVAVRPDPLLQQHITPGLVDTKIWRESAVGDVLERTTGGGFISVPSISDLPDIYAAALGFALPVRRWWRIRVIGTTKLYTDLWRLRFDGDPGDYGYTVSDVFYYRDGPTRYRLVHNRRQPGLHYGVHLQWLGERPEVFRFAWTFSAYNVIGRPVPGNGPLANDLGIVDESGANPNSDIHGLANLDVDRAFNTKIAAAVPIWRPVWLWLFATHYDGTPFTFYYAHEDNGQVAWVADQHRGSPFTFVGPLIGAREDFRLNVDAKLEATVAMKRVGLRIWFAAYNLFDFSNELVEMQSRAGRDGRLTLVQEIPRAVEFGLELSPQ
ncbi:MAG: hypothetical protein D6761_13920 [Candidatus Dadabacteria bacterium]|nr:MAG: hypothetical protein D6761_13920 [Candidatus Dadabacteria bacterium]